MSDFTDYPKTIGELQRERDKTCDSGSPRDVLIEMLRSIDSGEVKPVGLVVIFYENREDGNTGTGFRAVAPNGLVMQGMLSRALYIMNEPDE